jgi:hypothetical protein
MSSNPWTVVIGPANSGPAEVVDFGSWEWTRNLDDGCTLTFDTFGQSAAAQILSELDTDIWIYRGANVEQRFRVVEIGQTWTANGESQISVVGACYRRLLGARHVITTQTYVGVDQGNIIWNLIAHTQAQTNGNLGLTQGSTTTGVTRDRTYEPGTNILSAIQQLTEVINGPVWFVDDQLVVDVVQPGSLPSRATPIELGVNAIGLQRPSGAAAFANVGLGIGNVEATTMQVANASGLSTDSRGRWERTTAESSVIVNATLLEMAQGVVEESLSPAVAWAATLTPQGYLDEPYEPGDFVTIVQPTDIAAIIAPPGLSVAAQVVGVRISADANGGWEPSLTAVTIP